MTDFQSAPEGRDPELWEIAIKRAKFKKHLVTYLIINGMLWAIWFVTSNRGHLFQVGEWRVDQHPWPVWTSLFWGIGLAFHYADAYVFPRSNSVESEYKKLEEQKKNLKQN